MTKKIDCYKCEKCGKIYLHEDSAENCDCYSVNKCTECNCKIPKHRTLCDKCRELKILEKAKKVNIQDYKGEYLFDPWTDAHYSTAELYDYFKCDFTEEEKPKWLYGSVSRKFAICIDDAICSASDEMFEDFDPQSHCVDIRELEKFVDEWNEKQTCEVFDCDTDIVVLIPDEYWI